MNLNPDDFIVVSKPNYAVVKEPGAHAFFASDANMRLPHEPDGIFYISLEDLYKAELDGEPIDLFIHDIKSGITAKEEISTVLHGGVYQDEDYGATWVALTE